MDFPIKSKPVALPSEGFFYPEGHPLSKGTIEIRHMTAADEDILTDRQLLKKGEAIDRVIESVIVEEGVEFSEILNGDVGGIMIAVRIMAYGKEYPFEFTCPACGAKTENVADLTEIQEKSVDFDKYERHQQLFSVDLPLSETNVEFSLLTRGEVQKINKEVSNVKQFQRKGNRTSSNQTSANMTTRLRHLIQSVNGETGPATIRKFVQQMPARDSLALRKAVSEVSPDIELETLFECEACGHQEFIDIPLDDTFFFPTR